MQKNVEKNDDFWLNMVKIDTYKKQGDAVPHYVWSTIDYYPGGMPMPGRQFSSQSYSYGFNTQMKTDEIAGTGNHTTAKFWEYDTRLLSRWNRDPRPNPSLSDYVCNANNPIWNRDVLGDTTAIYNSKGTYLNTLNDKTAFNVLVVNSRHDKAFDKLNGLDFSKVKQNELDKIASSFRPFGLTYDIGSARAYYTNWSKAFPIKKIASLDIAGRQVFMNGKPLIKKLYAESVLYLTVVNNRINVPNTKPQSNEDLTENDASNALKIHPHPNLGKGSSIFDISWIEGTFVKSKTVTTYSDDGPSDTDYGNIGKRNNEERDIAVDRNNIYLYNSSKYQTITISR